MSYVELVGFGRRRHIADEHVNDAGGYTLCGNKGYTIGWHVLWRYADPDKLAAYPMCKVCGHKAGHAS